MKALVKLESRMVGVSVIPSTAHQVNEALDVFSAGRISNGETFGAYYGLPVCTVLQKQLHLMKEYCERILSA